MKCGRCEVEIADGDDEACSYGDCPKPLCYVCWEDVGHCGHPEAFERDAKLRSLDGGPFYAPEEPF